MFIPYDKLVLNYLVQKLAYGWINPVLLQASHLTMVLYPEKALIKPPNTLHHQYQYYHTTDLFT